jgi:hypothetical protein
MKILRNKIIFFHCLIGILCIESGCKKQLDINVNPNFPSLADGNPNLVFPTGVLSTTGMVGGECEILGGIWSQYFTQASLSSQYADIDSYDLPPTDNYVYRPWDILFTSGLENYQFVIDQARAQQDWNFFLMGNVMKAYTAEVLTDLHDQIPYSQALLGAVNLQPKFDSGYSVYTSMLGSLDSALGKDFSAITNSSAGKQDLIFGGNINNWIAFANTLKLKLYLRMINAHPDVASAGINAMYNSGASFLTADAAVTNFTDAPGLDNPFYEQDKRALNVATNLRASTTFVKWLEENNDPRIVYYFQSANPGSINQGDYKANNPVYQAAPTFRNSDHTSVTDPVEFISLAESFFLQAEADVRYFGGTQAQGLYNQGVLAAFAETGNDGSSFIAPGGAYAWGQEVEGGQTLGPIEQIIRQKWASFAYGCHALEGYLDKNRTGFPQTSPVYSTDITYVPGQFVVSKNSILPPGELPKRLVYPSDEIATNPNTPAPVPTTTPVWWGQ